MESSAERDRRLDTETWAALVDSIRCAAVARLDLLRDRGGDERVPCPWERLVSCDRGCRCGGAGTVTVEFLRVHYGRLATEVVILARPSVVRAWGPS